MFKKLDILILKTFIGPFLATFLISFIVFMFQIAWKYIDELIGKGLEISIILKFLLTASASLSFYAMPIAILLASIMCFGKLGESFELIAIKSSGISLLRFMRPLLFVAILLSIASFFLQNNLIPYSNLKFTTLYRDIKNSKMGLLIKPGVFMNRGNGGFNDYAIYTDSKSEDGNTLFNIKIFENKQPFQDASITAQKAIMSKSNDGKKLFLDLYNGVRLEERGNYGDTATEFIRVKFDSYRKILDLSPFIDGEKTNDSMYMELPNTKTIKELNKNIKKYNFKKDSLQNVKKNIPDQTLAYRLDTAKQWSKIEKDTLKYDSVNNVKIPDSLRTIIMDRAVTIINELRSQSTQLKTEIEFLEKQVNEYDNEWHKKIATSLACLILFFIGAPMGAIIRKGGLGTPILVAISFFVVYHLLNTFGLKMARNQTVSSFVGTWLSVGVLLPVCIFITYKANKDAQLFNKEFYNRIYYFLHKVISKLLTLVWKKIKPAYWA